MLLKCCEVSTVQSIDATSLIYLVGRLVSNVSLVALGALQLLASEEPCLLPCIQ